VVARIDTDRRVLEVVKSELRMSVHADKALDALRHEREGYGQSDTR